MRGIGSFFIIALVILILVEVISFLAFRQLLPKRKKTFTVLYWLISLLVLGIWTFAFINPERIRQTVDYQFFYFVISITTINLIPKLSFIVFYFISLIFKIFRQKFIAKNILMGGLIISLGILLNIGWGITFGRQNLRIEKLDLTLSDFPKELDGLTVVQLSDIHLASFNKTTVLENTVETVNRLKPDLIVFTGDMVNNYYEEMIGFEDDLAALNSKFGKYAILGNHDYGDYSNWKDQQSKVLNHEKICHAIEKAGFKLLLNESSKVEIKDTSIYIIGVENWGHPPFPQYANLDKAINEIPNRYFKLLLSHDPAHWEDQVVPNSNIPLTLSGHTHGGQTGFRLAGIELSPMYFIQKYWGGLYNEGDQYLYVNRGLGCVGLLGRIGMPPEITVIRLFSN